MTVFEKADRIGGLLRYGIPNFKMEKHLIDRRIEQMRAEGVEFVVNAHVGKNVPVKDLRRDFNAILLTGGAEHPRDLKVPGRELKGIHFAMDFLPQSNKVLRRRYRARPDSRDRQARGDHRRRRHGRGLSRHFASPEGRAYLAVRVDAEAARRTRAADAVAALADATARRELARRGRDCATGAFIPCASAAMQHGNVRKLHARARGRAAEVRSHARVPSSRWTSIWCCSPWDSPVRCAAGCSTNWAWRIDARGNVATNESYMSSVPGVFAAGDMRRGQSLVVWAIAEGRKAARGVDEFLMGSSRLPV